MFNFEELKARVEAGVEKYGKTALVVGVSAGGLLLGDAALAAATSADAIALPTALNTELGKLGFSGLITWSNGIMAIAGGLAILYAITRKVKQGAAHV